MHLCVITLKLVQSHESLQEKITKMCIYQSNLIYIKL
jgi:hypothetical protein